MFLSRDANNSYLRVVQEVTMKVYSMYMSRHASIDSAQTLIIVIYA